MYSNTPSQSGGIISLSPSLGKSLSTKARSTFEEDGSKSIFIQVKTSQGAYRKTRYGREGCEWDVGAAVIEKISPNFWYVFVDLKLGSLSEPDVYIVPSLWVDSFVKADWNRTMYFLPSSAWELTKKMGANFILLR